MRNALPSAGHDAVRKDGVRNDGSSVPGGAGRASDVGGKARGSFATGGHEQTPRVDGRKGRGRLGVKVLR